MQHADRGSTTKQKDNPQNDTEQQGMCYSETFDWLHIDCYSGRSIWDSQPIVNFRTLTKQNNVPKNYTQGPTTTQTDKSQNHTVFYLKFPGPHLLLCRSGILGKYLPSRCHCGTQDLALGDILWCSGIHICLKSSDFSLILLAQSNQSM